MLDDVERRRFPVEPARKDAAELAIRAAHVQLHEGAGILLVLPGRGGLAVAQPDDHLADAHGLAGPESQIAFETVALVEQADHRDALGHGRRAGGELLHRLRHVDGLVLDLGLALAVRLVGAARGAGRERKQCRQARAGNEAAHRDQSGVQA